MKRDRRRRLLLGGLALFTLRGAHAQAARSPTIGFLSVNSRSAMSARVQAFQLGLRELGYVEGKDISVEYRYADAKPERLAELAAELVKMKVRLIVTEGTTSTRYAKAATSTIPIVMAQDPDPVGTGFVASLARPGGNITGLSNLRSELSAKRLELLKETVPTLSRVTVLGFLGTPGVARELAETERAAERLGVRIEYHDVKGVRDVDGVFPAAGERRAQALATLGAPTLLTHRKKLVQLATESGIPAIYHATDFVDDGGLMSYSVLITDLFRRAASYVDRILKGANPATLPIETPNKVTFVVNLKAAKQIGLALPRSILQAADRVIQ